MDVDPLPKSRFQDVIFPDDLSSKLTIIGEHPLVILDVKSALGVCAHKHRDINKDRKVRKKALVFSMVIIKENAAFL